MWSSSEFSLQHLGGFVNMNRACGATLYFEYISYFGARHRPLTQGRAAVPGGERKEDLPVPASSLAHIAH